MLLAPEIDKLDFNQNRLAKVTTLESLTSSKTLVIIDSNVANPQQLAAGVVFGAAVRILNRDRDRISQITEILREYPNLETLHLVSHGSPGCLHLGNSKLNLDTLPLYAAKIKSWFSVSQTPHFPNSPSPRLLLYGCNVAQGNVGREFISKLQQLTNAQIQASSTKVGNSELGGNWQLDIAIAESDSLRPRSIAFNSKTQKNYAGIFAVPVANDDSIFPAAFDLSNLDGSNGFILKGIDEEDFSGGSVSSAGDFNGDGLADLIIGADYADFFPTIKSSGESYVVFGTSNPNSSIELDNLNGSNGFVFQGINLGDRSGQSVSSARDINGDGFDDIIVGASGADPNGNSGAGESYVIFGTSNSSSFLRSSSLDGSNGFVINGIDVGDRSGTSVSGIEDFNGDGLPDVIIGAPFADPNSDSSGGESYVVFGTSNPGESIELSGLNGSNGFMLNGVSFLDRSGFSVSSAGDFDGDGLTDIVIGVPYADSNGSDAGEIYVVFGTSNPSASIEVHSLNGSNGFVLSGITAGDFSGWSVSNAGDFNGDGLADVIIGAPHNFSSLGESYIVFGNSNPNESFELSSLDGSNGFILRGISIGDYPGSSVSNAGDINRDGFDDVIIGAPSADSNGNSNAGESYVVFGTDNPSSPIELSNLDGSNGFIINGVASFDRSGSSVSNAGDVNGDGIADVIIGARSADRNGINGLGESYVVFGRDFNTDKDTAFTTSSVFANDTDADGDLLSITTIDTTGALGIVTNNGDGTFDYDPNDRFEFLNSGETATDTFTYTVSDGIDTDTATVTITITGVEYPSNSPVANNDSILFPSAFELSSLNGSNGFVLNGIDEGDGSGESVSSAGDVNGDGLADVIIGARFADPNGNSSGESYVVFGTNDINDLINLSSLNGSNGFVINGIDGVDFSGRPVSSAGDVNGDGLADVIIGARWAKPNGNRSGESYVVFGTSNPT
ncbi:VCBS repeat-containing protein [Xenococcus sp. PCC 7305]|uniref:DUF4347 domain-containing protein n=1 Tax=Xenococcus sp. PCC 7305 TaxID=102125 RepID=UPI0002AC57D2|nr:DUF4347 domain-containing protein [Xenococcus sp. PCC 7305]ELS02647.1 VCBS repeat-containing protein [Xenococcus sp. PCC 7305]